MSRELLKTTIELIPTYNERESVTPFVRAVFGLYPETSMMVLDDNSPDGTADVVRGLQATFPNLHLHQRMSDRGFSKSYLDGFRKVLADNRYSYIVMMDVDFAHDPKEVQPMIERLASFDVVTGSRYVDGGGIENWDWKRRILSRWANFYARNILGIRVRDLTTGFICFRKEVLNKINLDAMASDGYAFLIEIKYKLLRAGFKMHEHPITLHERRLGQSKMSWGIIWESIWLPWKLRFKRI